MVLAGQKQPPAQWSFHLLTNLRSLLNRQREDHCPICGEIVRGNGVERYGRRFCKSWHADFYRPPLTWWRRFRWPEDDRNAGGGACCG